MTFKITGEFEPNALMYKDKETLSKPLKPISTWFIPKAKSDNFVRQEFTAQ